MSDLQQLESARRKMIRYRILKILDVSRPYPAGEGLIMHILIDADLRATQDVVRKELQYLADKNYLDIEYPAQGKNSYWSVRLLPVGVDYVDNKSITDAGIARPVL